MSAEIIQTPRVFDYGQMEWNAVGSLQFPISQAIQGQQGSKQMIAVRANTTIHQATVRSMLGIK